MKTFHFSSQPLIKKTISCTNRQHEDFIDKLLNCHTFYRYTPDSTLLSLQEIAKRNKLGCLWSGISKNMLLGQQGDDVSDVAITPFATFCAEDFEKFGYPLKYEDPDSNVVSVVRTSLLHLTYF